MESTHPLERERLENLIRANPSKASALGIRMPTILTKKTKKQKRNLVGTTIVDQSNMKQVRDLLCLR